MHDASLPSRHGHSLRSAQAKDARVVRKARDYLGEHGRFAFSAMTRYEIVRGLKAKNAMVQLQKFQTFCRQSMVLPITDAVLDRAAELWSTGYHDGHPHRDADVVIAATALQHQRALVTGNRNDFEWIPGSRWKTGVNRE